MQKLLPRIKPYKKYLIPSFALLSVFVVFLLSFFSAPIADDWGFYTSAHKHGFFSYLHLTYTSHTARFGQWGLIWLGFRLCGLAFTRIYPLISFAAFSIILALILHRSGCVAKAKNALFFSILACVTFLCACPSVFDTFLWLDSNLAHFTSIIFSLLIILEIITLYKRPDDKFFIARFVFLIATSFIAQFFSELTDILNISFLTLFCAYIFLTGRKNKNIRILLKICLPSLAALVIGFLILYYSPARIARSAYNHSSFGMQTIKESLKTYRSFFSHVPLLAYALIALTAFSFSNCLKTSLLNIKGCFLSVLVFIATSICSFIVICYAQGFAVPRTLTVTAFGFSFSAIYLLSFLIAILSKKTAHFKTIGLFAAFAISIILSAVFVPSYIEKIATRYHLVSQRDNTVREQIESGVDIVEVSEVPILVYGTAEDFYYYEDSESGEELPIWVAEQYIDYIRGEHEKPNYRLKKILDYSGANGR